MCPREDIWSRQAPLTPLNTQMFKKSRNQEIKKSGNPEISHEDRVVTEQLTKALNLIDIRVLDHIIIGDAHNVSFAQTGLL